MKRLFLLALSAVTLAVSSPATDLETGFRSPPADAKPWVYWVWQRANVTPEGLTKDLEALHRVGIGGVLVMMIEWGNMPPGKLTTMTDEFYSLLAHTLREAARLGIEVDFFNCEGWSTSGGPWVKPADSMQMLVWSEVRIQAADSHPKELQLPKPLTREGFYRDVAVLAYPTPQHEQQRFSLLNPTLTDPQNQPLEAGLLADGQCDTFVPVKVTAGPAYLTWKSAAPFTAGSVRFVPGPGPVTVSEPAQLQVSDDGVTFRTVASVVWPYRHPAALPYPIGTTWEGTAKFPAVTASYYRLVLPRGEMSLAEFELFAPAQDLEVIRSGEVVDLTASLKPDGTLDWKAPPGAWTILRFGHTPIGSKNHPATPAGTGLEADKLSAEAMTHHLANGMIGRIIKEAGPLAGQTLRYAHIDSYENGEQNWTWQMPDDFRARRGYDLRTWLPALAGRILDSAGQTKDFQSDFRRTVADLWEDNGYGGAARYLGEHGMELSLESYGDFVASDVRVAGLAGMPMGEFWYRFGLPGPIYMRGNVKVAAAGAHLYGRKYVGMEAFTAGDGWDFDPHMLKALGDRAFAEGANRFIFHNSPAQPSVNPQDKPGLVWGNGIYFMRNLTWFEQSRAWLDYLARCQFLLQQGHAVVDFLAFQGDGPLHYDGSDAWSRNLPSGYRLDPADRNSVLQLDVRDGNLVTPNGQSYRVLLLPDRAEMSPEVLRHVTSLVRRGATVVGPPPERAPGLSGQPQSTAMVQQLARELWGNQPARAKVGATASSTFPGFDAANLVNGSGLDIPAGKTPNNALHHASLDWISLDQPAPTLTFDLGGDERLGSMLVWNHNAPGEGDRCIRRVRVSFRDASQTNYTMLGEFEFQPALNDGQPTPVTDVVDFGGKTARFVKLEVLSNYGNPQHTGCSEVRFLPETGDVTDDSIVRRIGSGRVCWNEKLGELDYVTAALDLAPDLEWSPSSANLHFAHRRTGDTDIYFVANPLHQRVIVDCTFRVTNREPELWDPATGTITAAPLWRREPDGRITVTMDLADSGSMFVVFRKPAPQRSLVSVRHNGSPLTQAVTGEATVQSASLRNIANPPAASDLTDQIRAKIRDGRLAVDSLDVDALFNTVTDRNLRLEINASFDGMPLHRTLERGDTLEIPAETWLASAGEFTLPKEGAAEFLASQPGQYQFQFSDGQMVEREAKPLPAPEVLAAGWQVTFDPEWGGPGKVAFDRLDSWSTRPETGIRYYSGTAEYEVHFPMSADWLEANRAVLLDLGRLSNLAEVTLNDVEFGVLWKPPFRLDVSHALQAGDNRLRIRVTNQWNNRLIGDASLPMEQRVTRTSCQAYRAESPLQESGLLGPVSLIPAARLDWRESP